MTYIEEIKSREGTIYGDGTAMLCERLLKELAGKKTAKEQAEAAYAVLTKYAEDTGMNPKSECGFWKPGQAAFDGETNRYLVSLEAGPYEWAIPASMALGSVGVFCEPYFGFDLSFYPAEDA